MVVISRSMDSAGSTEVIPGSYIYTRIQQQQHNKCNLAQNKNRNSLYNRESISQITIFHITGAWMAAVEFESSAQA